MIFNHAPKIGSMYRDSSGNQFKVLKIAHVEHDAWIEYEKTGTKKHYNCRLPAFLERFSPVEPYRPWRNK